MRVNFFGDVCLDGIDTNNFTIDEAIAARAKTADCNVANLESPLTSVQDGLPYQAHLIKAEPKPSRVLELFDVFSLANNHIMDYGEAGLHETLRFLQDLGKGCFGAGDNREASFVPFRWECSGQQAAFLGFSRWHRATRLGAGATPDRVRQLARQVEELSREGCFVVVYPHWNYEYVDHPAPSNRRIARRLIDAGADLIGAFVSREVGRGFPQEVMTITKHCSPWMRRHWSGVVHLNGTANPHLVRRDRYRRFYDRVRAFLLGNLVYLASGGHLVKHPRAAARGLKPAPTAA